MLKHLGISLINCIIIIVALVLHRIIFRVFNISFENVFIYWGIFIAIIFVLTLLISLIFSKEKSRNM
ncbi:bacteriocin-like WGxF protein [Paenibacillus sp. GCM10012307]|uniref:Bacteriocin-like WGxF protein n=1 Tax=Paenibacillus roseus TaxID=2798579 RepID=A0A934J5Z3_9BACL|nr:bacteriocin-like WGxF protein [Paenibacillus roseus]